MTGTGQPRKRTIPVLSSGTPAMPWRTRGTPIICPPWDGTRKPSRRPDARASLTRSRLTVARFLGFILYRARRYDEALEQCLKAVELDPFYPPGYWFLAHVRRFFGPLTPECSENGRKTMIACLIHVNPSDTI